MKKIDRKTWILAGVMLIVITLLTWLLRADIKHGEKALGYWTMGDVGIYVAAALLGGPLSAIVAALGSMFADLFAGHAVYAVGSFLIKGVMAYFVAWHIKRGSTLVHLIKSVSFGGIWMVVAYFLYDFALYGNYADAAIGLPINILQVVACGIVAVLVLFLLGGKSYRSGNGFFAGKASQPSANSKRALK
ncbi:ECF transporter S component [Eubacteriales bacterium OttesenSCG-928-K08]|nr:ECF transporter S component [Eubacteriales bacterium OttesenSCG-928-K08]